MKILEQKYLINSDIYRLYTYKAKVTYRAIFLLIIITFLDLFINSLLLLPIPKSTQEVGFPLRNKIFIASKELLHVQEQSSTEKTILRYGG